MVGLGRYELDYDLKVATEENAHFLRDTFSVLGNTHDLIIDARTESEEEISTSNALRNLSRFWAGRSKPGRLSAGMGTS
jgi:hypothetical protein